MDEYTDEALLLKALAASEDDVKRFKSELEYCESLVAEAEENLRRRSQAKHEALMHLLAAQMTFRTLSEKLV